MLNLESLNEAQQKAVMHGNGPLLVLAGPGSGKTYTITQRIFYLIERQHIPPEKILVITFTKDAALAMQSRFRQLSKLTLPVNFGTFHSIFYHILRESHILQTNQILTLNQKKTIIFPILKQYSSIEETAERQRNFTQCNANQSYVNQSDLKYNGLSQGNSGQNDLSETAIQFFAAIGYYKNTGDLNRAAKKLTGEWQERFEAIMTAYEQTRVKHGAIDFDDMVYECRKLLQRDNGLRKYWQERFDTILIDEFQDISPMQYEVVRLLAGERRNVFAVGDDDQSIYGFRGAKPACLKRFAEEFHAEQICLNINYRSKKEIVRAANLVIGENTERFTKELYSLEEWNNHEFCNNQKETRCVKNLQEEKITQRNYQKIRELTEHRASKVVTVQSFQEREDQYHYLVENLKLLYHSHKTESVSNTRNMLNREDKQNSVKENDIRFSECDVNLHEQTNFDNPKSIGILFRTNTYMQGFAARLHREGIPYIMREKAVNIYEHFVIKDIMAYLKLAGGNFDRGLFLQVMNKPSRYISREALEEGRPDFDLILRYYHEDYETPFLSQKQSVIHEVEKWKQQMKYLAELSPFAAVSYIRKAIGYEKYLRERAGGNMEKRQEWTELLEWLSADAANYTTVKEWIEAQENYAKTLEHGETNFIKEQHPSKEEMQIVKTVMRELKQLKTTSNQR